MNHKNDAADYLEFAVEVIESAGRIALPYFRTDLEITNKAKKRSFDPVTRADREVEEYIRRRIREAFPDHGIFGEEFGAVAGAGSLEWLIDPIDGTRGFLCGSPMWGVLLGLLDGADCIAGLMHQPFVGDTYAGNGTESFHKRNGKRRSIRTRRTETIEEAVLCCTHRNMFRSAREMAAFERVETACRYSRFGTDCYGCCLLAHGFVDLVVEGDLEPYDVVPLIPIVEGAGGVISDWNGGPAVNGGTIVAAATRALHGQTLALLNSAS